MRSHYMHGLSSVYSNPLSSAAVGSNPFASVAANSWKGYSNTAVNPDSAGLSPNPAISGGSPYSAGDFTHAVPGGNMSAFFRAWCGGTYDSLRKKMWFFGGGHTDLYTNHWYTWDLDTQIYEHQNWPSVVPATYTDLDDGYLDAGNTIPSNRHTANSIVYISSIDRIYMSGYATGPNGTGNAKHWLFHPTAHTWAEIAASGDADFGSANCAAYDPTTGLLFIRTALALFSIDPTNLGAGWTNRVSNRWTYGTDYNSSARSFCVDVAARKILAFGNNEVHVWDISNLAAVTFDSSGSGWAGAGLAAYKAINYQSMTYDSNKGQCVGWGGGQTMYIINSGAKTVTTETMSGLDTPTAMITNGGNLGTLGRYQYIPPYDVFVAMMGVTTGTGAYAWAATYVGKRA